MEMDNIVHRGEESAIEPTSSLRDQFRKLNKHIRYQSVGSITKTNIVWYIDLSVCRLDIAQDPRAASV